MTSIIKYIKYLRWNLKWFRYPGKPLRKVIRLLRPSTSIETETVGTATSSEHLIENAWDKICLPDVGFSLDRRHLRLAGDIGGSASFVDVSGLYAAELNKCVAAILSDNTVTQRIYDYFLGEQPWLWNAALNYSIPKKGMSDSQFWHFDYGDSKQLHLFYYVTDVSEKSGPFSFMSKQISAGIDRNSMLVERLTDEDLLDKYLIDANDKKQLTGMSGELYFADPGVLLHQGARCSVERTVLFITLTTSTPYSLGGRSTMTTSARHDLYSAYNSVLLEESSRALLFTKEFFFK